MNYDDPMIKKIMTLYALHDEETQSIAIEHFMEWWKGTEELAEMGLQRIKEIDFGDRHETLQKVSQDLLDVHECGTSSLMFTYFLEFSARWLETLEEKDENEKISSA